MVMERARSPVPTSNSKSCVSESPPLQTKSMPRSAVPPRVARKVAACEGGGTLMESGRVMRAVCPSAAEEAAGAGAGEASAPVGAAKAMAGSGRTSSLRMVMAWVVSPSS